MCVGGDLVRLWVVVVGEGLWGGGGDGQGVVVVVRVCVVVVATATPFRLNDCGGGNNKGSIFLLKTIINSQAGCSDVRANATYARA